MTDLPSSLGIEAVELLAEGGRSVTVRVTGRWRRRRPELRGQPMLVVEAEGGRQRFLAMPEPPSLTGAAPGTWRMSFSVPAALAPELPGRTFLQLGGVMVPLPVGDVAAAGEAPDVELLEARRSRSSELAAESARRQAGELQAEVERVERELDEARAQSDRLRETISERDRRLRAAEQEVHAERALRAEVEQRLTRQARAAGHDLRRLHERVAELERELQRMRRAVDEAQHAAAAAQARSEISPPPAAPAVDHPQAGAARAVDHAPAAVKRAVDHPQAAGVARELELLRAAPAAPPARAPAAPPVRGGDETALGQEAAMADRRAGAERRVAALERELAMAAAEMEAQRRLTARAYEAIELVRGELRQLRADAATPPPAAAVPTEPVTRPPAPAEPTRAEPMGAEPVQAERLAEALARLRERSTPPPGEEAARPPAPVDERSTPPPAPADPLAPSAATKPWLAGVFRKLVDEDASAAGRLLLALLPAQRAADPRPVAYDLVLGDLLVAHVTVGSVTAHVELDPTPRPASEVDFQILGDLASIARLLAAGRLRRRVSRLAPRRRFARVRGERRRLASLDRLIAAKLTVAELYGAGVRLDPLLTMTVAALMVEPRWTAGERFTIAHRTPVATAPDAYLHVRDGRPLLASGELPHGPIETVVIGAGDRLLGVLAGAGSAADVAGEQRPLALLRQWLDRAQCG